MALQLDTHYSGRFTAASDDYPQGSFKNRTTSTSEDGSYFEKDWANDELGFRAAILNAVGATANGDVDTATSSQVFNALMQIIRSNNAGSVGDAINLRCNIPSVGATATFTADSITVATALGGMKYTLTNFSKVINLSTTGAGGMDSGTVPATGYVAIYAIYNPTTGASALLAVNATSAAATPVYSGSNLPSGFTASALISTWRTANSVFTIGFQDGKRISIPNYVIYSTSTAVTTYSAIDLSNRIPLNAKSVEAQLVTAQTTGNTAVEMNLASSDSGFGQIAANASAAGTSGSVTSTSITTGTMSLLEKQALYYKMANTTGATYFVSVRGYSV